MIQSKLFTAWVPTIDTVFDPSVHARTELRVTSVNLTQEEGGVLKVSAIVENLGVGIMAPGRDQYLLISFSDNAETAKLICRTVANSMPANLVEDLISLEFLAQPDDFDAVLLAFAKTKGGKPWVNTLISGTDLKDPSAVLETRSAAFHIDPVTHEITLSDIIDFDRLIDIGTHYVRDSMQPSLGLPPVHKVNQRYIAEHTQRATGTVDISDKVNSGHPDTGIATLTDVSSIGETGELGKGGGSGWSVVETANAFPNPTVTATKYWSGDYDVGLVKVWYDSEHDVLHPQRTLVRTRYSVKPLQLWHYYATKFEMQYDYQQSRREILNVTVTADVQDIAAFGYEEEDLDDIGLQSLTEDSTTPVWEEDTEYFAGDKVIFRDSAWLSQVDHTSGDHFNALQDEYADYPEGLVKPFMWRWIATTKDIALHDSRAFSFFETDNGRSIAEYGLLRARAFLRKRMRCLTVQFRGTWEDLYDVSLRDGCRIEHPWFPGGECTGKVIGFDKVWTNDKMTRYVDVTLGVSAANGIPATIPDGGVPYSEAFESGYCWADPHGVAYEVGDMQYTFSGEPIVKPVDPYRLVNSSYACLFVRWKNLAPDQLRVAAASQIGMGNAVEAVAALPTSYEVVMRNLASKEVIEREVTVTGATVTAMKGIDLKFGG